MMKIDLDLYPSLIIHGISPACCRERGLAAESEYPMKILVSDLRPNPFRDLRRYPVKEDKVAALRKSIHDTTFWDNLLVRKAPNGGEGYEIAYGHNRLAALKKEGISEIDVPVRKLSDTDMARIMAHENMEEWGSSADIEAETVRAIIIGFADGRVKLPKLKKGTSRGTVRVAPSFIVRSDGEDSDAEESSYTAQTLANFLGWTEVKVEAILNVLSAEESGLLDHADAAGLSTYQAEAVARQTRRIAKETDDKSLAKSIGKRLAAGMHAASGRQSGRGVRRQQVVTKENARRVADEMVPPNKRKRLPAVVSGRPKKMPPIEKFVDDIAPKLGPLFPSPVWKQRLEAVISHAHWLPKGRGGSLVRSLRALAERATKYADRLERAMEEAS